MGVDASGESCQSGADDEGQDLIFTYIDSEGSGSAWVILDGSQSHAEPGMSHLRDQKTYDDDEYRSKDEEIHIVHLKSEDHRLGRGESKGTARYFQRVEHRRHYEVYTDGGDGQEVRLKSQGNDSQHRAEDSGNYHCRYKGQQKIPVVGGDYGRSIGTDTEKGCDTHHGLTGIAGDDVK